MAATTVRSGNSARESGRTSVKLSYGLAGAMASAILAMLLLAAPARAQTYDPAYPVCLQIYQSMVDYYFECRYTSMAQCAASASGRSAQCVVNPYYAKPSVKRSKRQKRSSNY
jgi:Protein of unknown function (DUF3551)